MNFLFIVTGIFVFMSIWPFCYSIYEQVFRHRCILYMMFFLFYFLFMEIGVFYFIGFLFIDTVIFYLSVFELPFCGNRSILFYELSIYRHRGILFMSFWTFYLQTHDNKEHLAMMERILGSLPYRMTKKTKYVCQYTFIVKEHDKIRSL